ncbi:alpha/beta fold hydrolase [Streptomyces sp. YU58]|uniref:alpha/beta fold hydrolase n=1 Tax=Streptomyces sp. SX92 TaxID=3158972 RepID=UPI0027B88516|nr:hypothetical protein [Streptomyces coralus]WLW55298.1 hypothetical protein QU709_29910 [Streptomyces coralus]
MPGPQRLPGPLYRTKTQDEADNTRLQETLLTIPVRMITQAGLADMVLPPLQDPAPHATSADVPRAGHFLLHQAPDRVLAGLVARIEEYFDSRVLDSLAEGSS